MNPQPRIPQRTNSPATDTTIIVGCAVFLCWLLWIMIEPQLPITRTASLIRSVKDYKGGVFDHQSNSIDLDRVNSVNAQDIQSIYVDEVDTIPTRLLNAIAELPNLETLSVSKSISESRDFKRLFGVNSAVKVQVEYRMDEVPMKLLASTEAFRRDTEAECLVLFIDGAWSWYAPPGRRVVSKLVERWRDSNTRVTFARMDFTKSESKLWSTVQDWFRKNNINCGGMKTYGCVGRILWSRNGVIVDHDWAYQCTVDSLVTRTRRALSSSQNKVSENRNDAS